MALDIALNDGTYQAERARPAAATKFTTGLRRTLMPLASLKLTVVLFAMSICLVFAGTLAQKQVDVWEVIDHWFRIDERNLITAEAPFFHPQELFVRIPLQIFCIDLLWPYGEPPTTDLGLWFPRGWLIGLLMGINLLAAHTVRFTVQTRGARLWAGIGIIALGCLATYAAVQSGSSEGGVLSGAFVSWDTLWKLLLVALAAVGFVSAAACFQLTAKRVIERVALGFVAVASFALVGAGLYYTRVYQKAFIEPESMRILWQLLKGGGAGLVLLAGCLLVFKKRAGIVLLHGGIGLMFLYEVVVGTSHKESQMTIVEGESANWIQDVRSPEIAIIVPGEKEDLVTTIPKRLLVEGKTIRDERLPFDLKIEKWFVNANVRRKGPFEPTPATVGAGLSRALVELPKSVGTSGDSKVDLPAAYVELLDKHNGDKSLGVFMLTTQLAVPQRVGEVQGKPYEIELRFQRTYKPFTIEAKEVRADHYVASSRPKNYSSRVRVVDPANKVDREELIKMNSPMRFAGQTFYQSGYQEHDGHRITTLQVVDNGGWMLPYVGCMIVGVGMLAQFGGVLVRFLARRQTALQKADAEYLAERPVLVKSVPAKAEKQGKPRAPPKAAASPEVEDMAESRAGAWMLPVVVAAIVVSFLAYTMKPAKRDERGMDLAAFGKLPIAADARVKPYDALARSTLAYFSHKQTFKFDPADKKEASKPAIRWLLDVITNNPAAEDYKVFRIENDDLVGALDIPREEGLCYSWKQLFTKRHVDPQARPEDRQMTELEYQLKLAGEKERAGKTGPFERELGELEQRVATYRTLTFAFGDPKQLWSLDFDKLRDQPEELEQKVSETALRMIDLLNESIGVQSAVRKPPMAVPLQGAQWETVLDANIRRYVNDPSRKMEVDMVMVGVDMVMQKVHDLTKQQKLDEATLQRFGRWAGGALKFHEMVEARDKNPAKPTAGEEKVFAVLDAYRTGDGEKFNAAVADYRGYLEESPPAEYDRSRRDLEAFMLQAEPFFWCSYIYLVAALVACASWLGFSKPLNRTAWWIIGATFVYQTFALILRMYVTERPPVVNLYSSAVFIGWAAVLMGMLLERVYKNGVGNVIASLAGFGSLYIAHLLSRQGDTIEALQAVLDTQFWLTTHVVCITLGYSATYVAGLLGMLYVALGVVTPNLTRETAKDITRMIYGIVCFALFLSFVGTVLGGLWADDSWGRFWGWDPKENGALIIVLWNALVLHARWDGMIKDRGLAVLAAAGNITTSWSWFGVNQLGVGLHAYGFSKELRMFLTLFVVSSLITIILGLLPKHFWMSRAELAKPA